MNVKKMSYTLSMRTQDIFRLFALAAIWGGSFVFLRILAPVLGPIVMAGTRLFLAGSFLLIYFYFTKFNLDWNKNFKHYFIMGLLNSAIPFALFSFASLHLPASYGVLLNATSPLFGAVFSSIWLNEKFNIQKLGGLLMGCLGVGFISKGGFQAVDDYFLVSVLACLVGSMFYALAGIYVKKYASHVKAMGFAGGSQLTAGLSLMVFIPLSPIRGELNLFILLNFAALTVFCSMIAYILYYKLLSDVGPTKALTVTFLMPVFGMIWSFIFLHEPITLMMILGASLILAGTRFVALAK